uniref:Uncharacterized protein n=1 Tax=Arundo donax TaxID=35708 RepID=A0A0A9EFQ3_ARUDO
MYYFDFGFQRKSRTTYFWISLVMSRTTIKLPMDWTSSCVAFRCALYNVSGMLALVLWLRASMM